MKAPALLALLCLGCSIAKAQMPMGQGAAEPKTDSAQVKGEGGIQGAGLELQRNSTPPMKSSENTEISSAALEPKIHSPKTASLLSLACPGLGQLYNRKYWKAPLVWGALGGAAYFMVENRRLMRDMNTQFTALYASGSAPTAAQIEERDRYRGNRDLAILIGTGIYALQIIDATVDAHFFRFDINQDLSLSGGLSQARLCYRF